MDSTVVILIVEDDPDIRAIIEEALCEGGFDVAVATSGEEAVALLAANHTDYRALVTDIGLPGSLDGWEVARTGSRGRASVSGSIHERRA